MGIRNALVSGIKIADKVTKDVQGSVTVTPWVGDDGKGTDDYGTPFTVRCVISQKAQLRVSPTGQNYMTFATLTVLEFVADTAPNSGKDRQQPIDTRDIIVLPDGGTAPVIEVAGVNDPKTSRPFTLRVILGSIVKGD